MKKYLLGILFFLSVLSLPTNEINAQLANGSTAPDWTLSDLNGNSWNLYSILNSQKSAILDFSATWCTICWNYHNSNALKNTYNTYGPNGSNISTVFFIEGDLNTSMQCLYGTAGCTGGTKGDWTAGTPYPIINLTSNTVSNAYQVYGYPTVLGISPDKRVWDVGTASATTLANWVGQSFQMTASADVTNAYCGNEGAIDLTVTNGYQSKTYSWSNGASTQDISGLSPGSYSVVITDGNGYFINRTYTISGPSTPLSLNNFSQVNPTCNGANNGSISLTPQGGNGGYTYQWSNGGSTSTISNLSAGAYSVVVTDAQGCTKSQNFTLTQPSAMAASVTTTVTSCNTNNGSATISASGGNGSFTYQLNNNAPTSNNVFSGLSSGSYTYKVFDGNSCFISGQFVINTAALPTAQSSAPQQLNCSTQEVTIFGTGSSTGSNISYQWTTTNGNIVSGNNSINAIVNAAGEYNLLVTNNQTMCSANSSVTVVAVNNAPIANAGNSMTINCNIPTTTLNGSGSSTGSSISYLWSTTNGNIVSGSTTQSPTVDKGGIYLLIVTNNANGCETLDTVSVIENKVKPSISVTNGQLTCSQTMSEICASSNGANITWLVNGNNINGNCISVNSAGSYTATATSTSNGCTETAVSVVTSSTDLPQISIIDPDPLTCTNTSTTIVGSLTGNISDHTISWSTSNGNIVSGGNTLTPTVNQAGSYTLTAINNASQCSSSIMVNVTANLNTPIAQFTNANANGQLTLTSTSPSANGTVSWTYNGQTASGNSVTISFPASGSYEICMTYTNECGTDTKCETISYTTALALSGEVTNAKCNGETGSITLVISGGFVTPLSYLWTGPNGFTSVESSLSGLTSGSYTCVVTDAAGFTSSQTFILTEPTLISGNATIVNATNNQANGSINLIIEGGTGNLAISWSNGGVGNFIEDLAPGSYTAIVTDQNNCTKSFGPFLIQNTTSVSDPSFINDFIIYPNPTSDFLNLKLDLDNTYDIKLNIYNQQGQIIDSKNMNGSTFDIVLNTIGYHNSIYILEIQTSKGVVHRKFLKVD